MEFWSVPLVRRVYRWLAVGLWLCVALGEVLRWR